MVADCDYIVRKLVRVADGRVKPGHDGGRESVFSAPGIVLTYCLAWAVNASLSTNRATTTLVSR
jgi:hypothetical protein